MSRSYKKVPITKDRGCGKDMKKFANKKVRRTNELINGGTYKKVFDQWEIHDYVSRWTKEEAISNAKTFEELIACPHEISDEEITNVLFPKVEKTATSKKSTKKQAKAPEE